MLFLWCSCSGSNAAVVYETIIYFSVLVKESIFFWEWHDIGYGITGMPLSKNAPKCIISTSKSLTFFGGNGA